MRTRIATLLLAAALLAFSASLPAETKDYCDKCHNTGKIKCKKYPESFPYYCSTSLDEKRCYDLGWKPCDKCKGTPWNAEAVKEYNEWIRELSAWDAAKRQAVDMKLFGKDWKKHRVIHVETPNWNFATNMVGRRIQYLCLPYPPPAWLAHALKIKPKIKEKRLRKMKFSVDADLAARIYAERLEYFYKVFIDTLEADLKGGLGEGEDEEPGFWDDEENEEEGDGEGEEDEFGINKTAVGGEKWGYYIWRQEAEQKRASREFCGSTSGEGVTLYAPHSLHTLRDKGSGDDMLLHKVVHTASQVVLSDYLKYERDAVPCWFDEALGHWFEYELLGSAKVCTRRELQFEITIPATGLRGRVYKMVKSGDYEPLSSFCGLDFDKLTPKQRVQAFSIVDYMLKDPKKCREWLRHVKEHKDQGRAFRDVYDITMSEFEDEWAKWVLETYNPTMH